MAECEEERKSLLMRVKEKSEKADLKLNIQKTKIKKKKTHLRSWHLVPSLHGKEMGGKVEAVTDYNFGGAPKSLQMVMVTAVTKLKDACSLEGKL